MGAKTCGCSTPTCGCCEGTRVLTPMPTSNRPGLDSLQYRVGTHGAFLETMKARLAVSEVEAAGADGQTLETFRPLQGLTTRDTSDPAIALLDAWATVGDVLTFYQERIANEGYLRTATERRSVLELARLVGYAPRPGVASTVYLAYTLEDTQLKPVEIPAGAASQSIPGPNEQPQSFETSDSLIARSEWNNLQVRRKRPQNITLASALSIETIYLAGTAANLKTGDLLLWVFGDEGNPSVVRIVARQCPSPRTTALKCSYSRWRRRCWRRYLPWWRRRGRDATDPAVNTTARAGRAFERRGRGRRPKDSLRRPHRGRTTCKARRTNSSPRRSMPCSSSSRRP